MREVDQRGRVDRRGINLAFAVLRWLVRGAVQQEGGSQVLFPIREGGHALVSRTLPP